MATLLPGLVFDYAGGKQHTTLYSIKDGARHPCRTLMDALHGKRIWVTAQGWVLVWEPATLATFLWNPHDDARVVLPSLVQAPPVGTLCVMSGKPTDDDGCTVVVFDEQESRVMWYCRHGGAGSSVTAEWVRYQYDLGGEWVPTPWVEEGKTWITNVIPDLAACGGGGSGKFCTHLSSDKYAMLDFSLPEPVLTTTKIAKAVEMTMIPGKDWTQAYVYSLDLDGDFHTVWVFFSDADGIGTKIFDITVNRMDSITGAVRVDNIGDRAIIVGGSSSSFAAWCPASELGLLPNSVYWMSRKDGCLHVHDIGTKKKKVRKLVKDVAKLTRKPFWMLPVDT